MQYNQPNAPPVISSNPQLGAHPIAGVAELLQTIFDSIQEDEFGCDWSSPSLLACALVCRFWRDNALRSLWERASLLNLISVLGEMKYTNEDGWYFVREIDPRAYSRFHYYASLVKYLTFYEDPSEEDEDAEVSWQNGEPPLFDNIFPISPRLLATMPPDRTHLLPSMVRLSWSIVKESSGLEVLPFLSPRVDDLCLEFLTDVEPMDEDSIDGEDDTVEEAHTHGVTSINSGTGADVQPNANAENAAEGEASPSSGSNAADGKNLVISLFKRLRMMPDVQPTHLEVGFGEPPRTPLVSEEVMRWLSGLHHLSSLKLLHIDCKTPEDIRFDCPTVKEFFWMLQFDSPNQLRNVLGGLVMHCHNLEDVTLKLSQSGQANPIGLLPFNAISPLLQLPNLVSVIIDGDVPCTVSQEDIRAMGEAWQHLDLLSLCRRPNPGYTTLGTPVDCIALFATAFKGRLSRIDILLDCNSLWGVPVDRAVFLKPLELIVGASLLPDSDESRAAMVDILARVCPTPGGLDIRTTTDLRSFPGARQDVDAWAEVRRHIESRTQGS